MYLLYVVYAREANCCKIGYSLKEHLDNRISNLQTGSPLECELVLVYDCPEKDVRIIEDKIHHNPWFREYYTRGEWYDLCPEEVEVMILLEYGLRPTTGGIHALFKTTLRERKIEREIRESPLLQKVNGEVYEKMQFFDLLEV